MKQYKHPSHKNIIVFQAVWFTYSNSFSKQKTTGEVKSWVTNQVFSNEWHKELSFQFKIYPSMALTSPQSQNLFKKLTHRLPIDNDHITAHFSG